MWNKTLEKFVIFNKNVGKLNFWKITSIEKLKKTEICRLCLNKFKNSIKHEVDVLISKKDKEITQKRGNF